MQRNRQPLIDGLGSVVQYEVMVLIDDLSRAVSIIDFHDSKNDDCHEKNTLIDYFRDKLVTLKTRGSENTKDPDFITNIVILRSRLTD